MKDKNVLIKEIEMMLDKYVGNGVIFYENGKWYSNHHGRYITEKEIGEFVKPKMRAKMFFYKGGIFEDGEDAEG